MNPIGASLRGLIRLWLTIGGDRADLPLHPELPEYAREAILVHGALRQLARAAPHRALQSPGRPGFDPVPPCAPPSIQQPAAPALRALIAMQTNQAPTRNLIIAIALSSRSC
jgi:hypothetical protein